jgi:hypothetical protein
MIFKSKSAALSARIDVHLHETPKIPGNTVIGKGNCGRDRRPR